MGNVHPGIPRELALQLKDKYGLKWFIETGTGGGADTVLWASQHFTHCTTIEVEYHYCMHARGVLKEHGVYNVTCLCGDSETYIGAVIYALQNQPALIWLDAHWSPDLKIKPRARKISPLIAELSACRQWGAKCVLMIDDIHLIDSEEGWPKMSEIESFLKDVWTWSIIDDVLVAEPKNG